ncbi:MAG: hypothetical protein EXR75_15015, partial [Myxococcales bacterium]|nr:hypothetical protein [Myxococcales bacterium]
MTELFVIFAICALGFTCAGAIRSHFRQAPRAEPELVIAAGVVHDAALRFLRRQGVVVALVASVVGASVLLCYGLAYQLGWLSAAAPRAHGVVTTLGFAAGSSAALGVALL